MAGMSTFPTEEQARVIGHRGRPLVVVAGPGTGKTRTVVERMIGLLSENPQRVVSFLTFTRTSRRDTYRMLREAVGRRALDIAEDDFPRISTLHRFAKGLVHRYAAACGRDSNFSVLVEGRGEKHILISDIIDDLGLAVDSRELNRAIIQFRATGQWPAEAQLTASEGIDLIETFERLLRLYNTFDMEGLVLAASDIVSTPPSGLPRVLLQVDEYQDLNPMDQKLVRLVTATQLSEVVVAGDDAQSIYRFRHAHPDGIRELWDAEDWDKIRLPECHRLPAHVLLAAHSLISGKGYLGAEVTLPEDDGKRLLTLQCTASALQTRAVARQIQSVIGTGRRSDGTTLTYGDFMVLCPTNMHVNQVTAALTDTYGIPTKQKSSASIPDDVWKLLVVLRMLNGPDGLALRQWLEAVGLCRSEIRILRREAIQSGKSFYEHCSVLPDDKVAHVFASIDRLNQALVDPLEFREALRHFPSLALAQDASAVIDEIVQYLPSVERMIAYVYERYGVFDAEDEKDEIPEDNRVLVTTMHSAKGLESEFVFIMWLNDTFIPAPGRDIAEEERVLYVALTRARQEVILTFHERYDVMSRRRLREEAMSPFLRSIRHHLDVRRVTASSLQACC